MANQSTAAAPAKEYEPIVYLTCALENAGQELIASGGYLTALWHMRSLNDHRASSRIEDARKAAQKALAAIEAYEAATIAIAKLGGAR